ncbi:MAG: L-serine ammonia-lyase, iron-sulfur-dependent, subunit alpha, partial [Bacteroidia bacterium]|nr:L-serine ammonia-lyase, iron-sulfur-dependent, subunit alpha [Bacteroidia bacterium]
MTTREKQIIELINREVKPALGCTEPIAVALAVAKAVELIESKKPLNRLVSEFKIDVAVSGNILKNGMGVGVPGTGMVGLHIAAALGAVCGKSEYGLEVLHDLDDRSIARAKGIVADNLVEISIAETEHKLYVSATVETEGETATAVIEDSHDHIVKTMLDHQVLSDSECKGGTADEDSSDYGITVGEALKFAESADAGDIAFILDDRTLNLALAKEGLRGCYGLCVGRTIKRDSGKVFGDSFLTYAMSLTAAASDARMAGCTLPAMSNSGSGNQGITVSMPVIAYAEHYGVDDEKLSRALILSNLIAIHIKHYLGPLSALCGCVVASTGAACGITWLKGGHYWQICATIKNMIGNITGMVCDGAKVGCAMKVASGVSSAIQSSMLALDGHFATEHDGIIDSDIESTIKNLGRIGSVGMEQTDEDIIDIMQ